MSKTDIFSRFVLLANGILDVNPFKIYVWGIAFWMPWGVFMLNTAIETIGWIGMFIAILVFIPQVIKIFKIKDASSLSKFAFNVNALGIAMWVVFSATVSSYQRFASTVSVILLMQIIFYYIYKSNRMYFYLWIFFTASILATSIVLLLVVDHSAIPLPVHYVFVTIASLALAVAFVPQIRLVFIQKDFRAYSFATSTLIVLNNMLWAFYWIGIGVLAHTGQGDDPSLFPVYLIGGLGSIFRVLLQLSAAPLYIKSKLLFVKFVLSDLS